jgi:hypothetical protein
LEIGCARALCPTSVKIWNCDKFSAQVGWNGGTLAWTGSRIEMKLNGCRCYHALGVVLPNLYIFKSKCLKWNFIANVNHAQQSQCNLKLGWHRLTRGYLISSFLFKN